AIPVTGNRQPVSPRRQKDKRIIREAGGVLVAQVESADTRIVHPDGIDSIPRLNVEISSHAQQIGR
ncbi:MAG: hypothetical protein K8R36_18075, partial [Planctomycetales bacterium]|nr:hypothetical protein [Planctomycetales bacterium]